MKRVYFYLYFIAKLIIMAHIFVAQFNKNRLCQKTVSVRKKLKHTSGGETGRDISAKTHLAHSPAYRVFFFALSERC